MARPLQVHERYDSLAEFAAFADRYASEYIRTRGSSFSGATLTEALRMARDGWPEGAAKACDMARRLGVVAGGRVLHHEPTMAVEGGELDIGAYVQGVPECWIDTVPEYRPASGGIVRITINMAVSAGVGHAAMIARGTAIAGLVSALEVAGRSAEVVAQIPGGGRGSPGTTIGGDYGHTADVLAEVTVKRAGEVLNLSELTYSVAHPSMYRVLGFSFYDYCSIRRHVRNIGSESAYGKVCHVPAELLGDVQAPPLHLFSSGAHSEQDALSWIMARLQEQGVEVRDKQEP